MAILFDAHCHLATDPDQFSGSPVQAGPDYSTTGRLLCGVSPQDWDAIAYAVARWPGTIAAYGVHPWMVEEVEDTWFQLLESRLNSDPAAWLGEAGLDWLNADFSHPDIQTQIFRRQLRLAARLQRKINLHCVKAWDELVQLLDEEYLDGKPGGPAGAFIIHSFAGPHQQVSQLVDRGAYFSVGQLASRKNSRKIRARIALLPPERLLLESDAFLQPTRDETGELAFTLEWLAELRGESVAQLAGRIEDNARSVFHHG